MKQILLLIFGGFLLAACTFKPEPIQYGTDACDHCRMTIVDHQHGAEVITTKGKIYKFDAIECMVHYVQDQGPGKFGSFWINDYTRTDGELIDATACTYLISQNIPSPMGAFLSGFADGNKARGIQAEKGGEVFDWAGLFKKLEN